MSDIGHYEYLQARAARAAARNPHLARKIMGLPPAYVAPVEHHIEVNCKTGERRVIGMTPLAPKAKPAKPVNVDALKAKISVLKRENGKLHDIIATLQSVPVPGVHTQAVMIAFCKAMEAAGQRIDDQRWTLGHLRMARRPYPISHPRMVCMWLADRITGESSPTVARAFGGKDHTSALHAYKRAREIMEDKPVLREVADAVLRSFGCEETTGER